MKRIGIVAALPSELRPLVRAWTRRGQVFEGRIGSINTVAACAGMGENAVIRACERVLATGAIDALISVGYAGSLSCGLRPPEACAVREVIDAHTGERFSTAELPNQTKGQLLVTLDHVAGPAEKRSLAEKWQAVLVDMEAATVARFARTHSLTFLCFKAITDGPNDELPDFSRFIHANGHLRLPAFVAWTLWHPRYWRSLGDLEKHSRTASHQLASILSSSLSTR